MKKVLTFVAKIFEYCASVCLVIFCLTSFLQIVVRYLGGSLVCAEEIARFSFIYMVFTGCSVGVYKKSHYNFDIFGNSKNRIIAKIAHIISCIFQIGFFGFLFYTSLKFVPQMHARASSILRVPVSIPYSSIILFAGFSLLFVIVQSIEELKSTPEEDK